MSDILDEVVIDYKDETKLKWFKKLVPVVIVATLIVIITMLVYEKYTSDTALYDQEMSDLFIKAVDVDDNHTASMEALNQVIDKSDNGVADLASLEKIRIQLATDQDKDKVLEELYTLSKNAQRDMTKEYAKLLWMNIMLDNDKISEKNDIILNEMMKYFENDKTTFFASANILKALFCVKKQNIDDARKVLRSLIDNNNVHASSKDQARAILANLNI